MPITMFVGVFVVFHGLIGRLHDGRVGILGLVYDLILGLDHQYSFLQRLGGDKRNQ